jgi:hypothetical protein
MNYSNEMIKGTGKELGLVGLIIRITRKILMGWGRGSAVECLVHIPWVSSPSLLKNPANIKKAKQAYKTQYLH